MKQTLTLNECAEVLSNAGFPIGNIKLRNGIVQRVFPFGYAIETENKNGRQLYEFIIYKKDVQDFIEQHDCGETKSMVG